MWRFTWDQLQDDLPQRYFDLAKLYDRLPK
jgi:hypothetical protein